MPISWSAGEIPGGAFSATTATTVSLDAALSTQCVDIVPANTESGESNSNARTIRRCSTKAPDHYVRVGRGLAWGRRKISEI